MTMIEFETPTLDEKGEIIAQAHQSLKPFTENLGKDASLDMIVIPSGMFQMGSPPHHGNPDERPQHFVTIKSFRMGKFLVTQQHD